MEGNPDIVISGSTMEICDQDMNFICKRIYNLTDAEVRKKLFRYSPFCHGATIYRTDIARKIGGYSETFYPAEDYHQDYYQHNSAQLYCRIVINPKLSKLRSHYHDKLKT